MNHIKIDDVRGDIRIPNKITDIIKKKRLKWFCHMVYKNNVSNGIGINFTNKRCKVWKNN